MRLLALALLFPLVCIAADCDIDPTSKKCFDQQLLKKKVKSQITIDEKLEKQLQATIEKQKHEHLKTKIIDSQKAFLSFIDAECISTSWHSLQAVLDDEGLQNVDQQIETDTINQCKDKYKKDRIYYLKTNY